MPSVIAFAPRNSGIQPARTTTGEDAEELVEALRAGNSEASTALFDRYGAHVERVLARVLGVDTELTDLLQEVFARALAGAAELRDGARLKGWLTSIAVFTARECIRRRQRRRWLRFLPFGEVPEPVCSPDDFEGREVVRATYALLDRLPADERIAFALRFIDGMELVDTAQACGVSLATIKRRLARAEQRFAAMAREHPIVSEWLDGGPWR